MVVCAFTAESEDDPVMNRYCQTLLDHLDTKFKDSANLDRRTLVAQLFDCSMRDLCPDRGGCGRKLAAFVSVRSEAELAGLGAPRHWAQDDDDDGSALAS